jgi:hypothetical protein
VIPHPALRATLSPKERETAERWVRGFGRLLRGQVAENSHKWLLAAKGGVGRRKTILHLHDNLLRQQDLICARSGDYLVSRLLNESRRFC